MRARLALLTVLMLVTAGCLGSNAPTGDDGDGPDLEAAAWSTLRCGSTTAPAGSDQAAPAGCNPFAGGGPANEVTIAVDPTDASNVVAASKDYTLGDDSACGPNRVWSGLYVSHDGGRSWNHSLFDGYPGGPEDPQLTGFECNTDPVLVFADDGTLYFSGLAYGGEGVDEEGQQQGSAIWVARSEDAGDTWTDARIVASSSDAVVFHDKQWMAVGPDETVAVTWSAFVFPGGNTPDPGGVTSDGYGAFCQVADEGDQLCYTDQIVVSTSTDEGDTWSQPTVLAEDQPQQVKQFSDPSFAADGTLHVTWVEEDDLNGTVYLATSSDGGSTWTPAGPIFAVELLPGGLPNTDFRTSTYPVMEIDRSHEDGTRMVLAWADNRTGDADVYLTQSLDGGLSWSEHVRVNDDDTATDQFMPWVDVGPDGTVHVAWMDRRHDPANVLIDTYHATVDPGLNVSENQRLTPVSFDGDEGFHQSGVPFIGDYIGVSASQDVAYVVWPDTRNATAGNDAMDGSWTRTAAVLR